MSLPTLPEIAAQDGQVLALLSDESISHTEAARSISSLGYSTTETSVRRYRRRYGDEADDEIIYDDGPYAGLPVEDSGPTPLEQVQAQLRRLPGASRKARPDKTFHLMIPDTQARPGTPTDHLEWIGHYIVDKFWGKNLKVIHIGDHADMKSLSSYDKGKRGMEGQRYVEDIKFANEAFELLDAPTAAENARRAANGQSTWEPLEKHITLGNHEYRIERATEADAQLEGLISYDDLNYARLGWQVHDYLQPVFVDGVGYVHFLANPMTGNPYGGSALNRLQKAGHSYTMGHQQTFDYAERYVRDKDGRVRSQHGIIAGACYLHLEDYKGPQGNPHWRGIVVKHEVEQGSYDLMKVSLDYLCRRYEGTDVRTFLWKKYKMEYY